MELVFALVININYICCCSLLLPMYGSRAADTRAVWNKVVQVRNSKKILTWLGGDPNELESNGIVVLQWTRVHSAFSGTFVLTVVCVRIAAELKHLKISLLLMRLGRKCR